MPLSPTIIVTNLDAGAAVTGVHPTDADGLALTHGKYIQMAGGLALHTRPMTDGGAIVDPSMITYELTRRMSGRGLYSKDDKGGENQFGYSVSQIIVDCPGITGTVLEVVNQYTGPTEVTGEALTLSPAVDGNVKRFKAPLANAAVMANTLRLELSTGEVLVDDGNGVLVRYEADGKLKGVGARVGYVRYGLGPSAMAAEVVILLDEAPAVGTTVTASYWHGTTQSVMTFFNPVAASVAWPVDQFVWGRGHEDGPLMLGPGQYLRVRAGGVLGSAGSITAVVGGSLPRGMGANVYGFANRQRSI